MDKGFIFSLARACCRSIFYLKLLLLYIIVIGLEIVGVGYRAEVSGTTLVLNVGFSHQVKFPSPEGIVFEVKQSIINVTGIDKQKVGETAAQIRRIKPPEPYKGKGIRYVGEIVRKKAGKAAKAAGGAGAK